MIELDYAGMARLPMRACLASLSRTEIGFAPGETFTGKKLAVQRADISVSPGFFDILTRNPEIRTVFALQKHPVDIRLLRKPMANLHKQACQRAPRRAKEALPWR